MFKTSLNATSASTANLEQPQQGENSGLPVTAVQQSSSRIKTLVYQKEIFYKTGKMGYCNYFPSRATNHDGSSTQTNCIIDGSIHKHVIITERPCTEADSNIGDHVSLISENTFIIDHDVRHENGALNPTSSTSRINTTSIPTSVIVSTSRANTTLAAMDATPSTSAATLEIPSKSRTGGLIRNKPYDSNVRKKAFELKNQNFSQRTIVRKLKAEFPELQVPCQSTLCKWFSKDKASTSQARDVVTPPTPEES